MVISFKTDFHNKDFALSLTLKWRLRWTQKWLITTMKTLWDWCLTPYPFAVTKGQEHYKGDLEWFYGGYYNLINLLDSKFSSFTFWLTYGSIVSLEIKSFIKGFSKSRYFMSTNFHGNKFNFKYLFPKVLNVNTNSLGRWQPDNNHYFGFSFSSTIPQSL